MKGAIVVGGGRMDGEAIRKAVSVGVSALVSGGIDDQDLKETLGYDLGVAVTGSEKIGLTLIVTEGFGDIAMAERTFRLLASRAGAPAAVNGATQIRAGVHAAGNHRSDPTGGQRAFDRRVADRHKIGSGRDGANYSRSVFRSDRQGSRLCPRIADARFGIEGPRAGSGGRFSRRIIVPRANVELIES